MPTVGTNLTLSANKPEFSNPFIEKIQFAIITGSAASIVAVIGTVVGNSLRTQRRNEQLAASSYEMRFEREKNSLHSSG